MLKIRKHHNMMEFGKISPRLKKKSYDLLRMLKKLGLESLSSKFQWKMSLAIGSNKYENLTKTKSKKG